MSYLHYISDFSKPLQDCFWGKFYSFKNYKVYKSYRQMESELIRKIDFEKSFTGQFIKNEFIVFRLVFDNSKPSFVWIRDSKFNPTLNWFGVSIYSPDRLFIRGEKAMIMSLQGASCVYNENYEELFKSKSVKYISLYDSNELIYQDWSGNLPDKNLIEYFLK